MNLKILVVLLYVPAALASVLYVPWILEVQRGQWFDQGYAFIWDRPVVGEVDLAIVALEFVAITIVFGALLYLASRYDEKR